MVGVTLFLIALTLKLSVAEFVDMQRLTVWELRRHLDLPKSCEPLLAAVRTSRRGQITVFVTCGGTAETPSDEAGR